MLCRNSNNNNNWLAAVPLLVLLAIIVGPTLSQTTEMLSNSNNNSNDNNNNSSIAESKWWSNLKTFSSFKCSVPQPRAIPVTELHQFSPSVNVDPIQAVLHRCESSGCCPAEHECKPISTESVQLFFKVEDMIITTSSIEIFPVEAINHTRCACERIKEDIKR